MGVVTTGEIFSPDPHFHLLTATKTLCSRDCSIQMDRVSGRESGSERRAVVKFLPVLSISGIA